MSDAALLDAVLRIESTWSRLLVDAGVAPADARFELNALDADAFDVAAIAQQAEATGNYVVPVLAVLRERLPDPTASWLHRGLTSQDVVDTATMLLAQACVQEVRRAVVAQVEQLSGLVRRHRATPMVARTLTQPAVPTTFGVRAATWLRGLLDAHDDLSALTFPAQLGGAAGTLGALVELGGAEAARRLLAELGPTLGLEATLPWHTTRAPVTRIGDAATRVSAAWGHIANDVLVLGRPELGELAEATAGGSSTMPGKANPTLSVLLRRHALAAPQLSATLHLAAAEQVDERADGGWHLEWEALATLLRRTLAAAHQATALLEGLHVDVEQMAARAAEYAESLRREQRTMADLVGRAPRDDYLGLADDLIDQTLHRAAQVTDRRTA